MKGFITLSARISYFVADIRTLATLMTIIQDDDPTVPLSVAEIVAAVQQMVVFFV